MRVVASQLIYISSKNRDNGTSNNFTVYFAKGLIQCESHQKLRITVADLVMKREFYAISVNNQNFQFIETDATGLNPITHNILLDRGFYSVYDLATMLTSKINAASSYFTIVISYDKYKNLYTFVLTKNNPTDLNTASFNFNVPLNAHELLGFDVLSYPFVLNIGDGKLYLISTEGVSVSGTDSIYIRTNLLNEVPQVEERQGVFQVSDTLARIPIVVAPFNNIVYTDNFFLYSLTTSFKYIDSMSIRITDIDSNLINLNGDYSITLKIDTIQDDEQEDIIKEVKELKEMVKLLVLSLNQK